MREISILKERISQYLDFKGINKSAFYKKTGASNGILSQSNGLSEDNLMRFLNFYSDINPEWLLTGKGDMLKSDNSIKVIGTDRKTKDPVVDHQEVPLYDFEATAGLVELFKQSKQNELLNTIKIPNIPACDGAISITGDSMYPLLKSGDIIMYKEVSKDINNIFYGEMYLLGILIDDVDEMVTVKYVHKSDLGKEYIKLVSQNQYHQPKDVQLSRITAMAMVKVSIRKNTMF